MADNTTLNSMSGGDVIADEDMTANSQVAGKVQIMKLMDGTRGSSTRIVSDTAGNLRVNPDGVTQETLALQTDYLERIVGATDMADSSSDYAGATVLTRNATLGSLPEISSGAVALAQEQVLDATISGPVFTTGSGLNADMITGKTNGYIDVSRYRSFHLQVNVNGASATTWTVQQSNDGVNWFQMNAATPAALNNNSSPLNGGFSTTGGTTLISGPIALKYLKVNSSLALTAGSMQAIIRLSMTPYSAVQQAVWAPPSNPLASNIAAVGGTTTVSAGLAGVLPVAGPTANAVAPTANPNLIAGIDTSGLTRRILTDTSGRVATNLSSVSNIVLPNQTSPVEITNTDASEGMSETDLLFAILQELRVLTFQMSELPRLINLGSVTSDDPDVLRLDVMTNRLN